MIEIYRMIERMEREIGNGAVVVVGIHAETGSLIFRVRWPNGMNVGMAYTLKYIEGIGDMEKLIENSIFHFRSRYEAG